MASHKNLRIAVIFGIFIAALTGIQHSAFAACTSPAGIAGGITWNGTDSVIWCDGTNWYALKNAAGSSGNAGYIQFSNGSGGFSNSGTTAGEHFFWDNTNKRLGIGTTTPATKLDVLSWNMQVGADWATGTARTDATMKGGYLTVPHYTNAQKPMAVIAGMSDVTSNSVHIGGYTSAYNAATDIRFYTAANSTTDTGTLRMLITSAGNVGIGTASPQNLLNISSAGGLQIGANTDSYWTSLSTNQLQFNRAGGVSYIRQQAIGGALRFTTSNVTANDTDAMHIAANGNVGIGTTTPTNALTFPTSSTGIALYNTADQTTNYERGSLSWDTNTLALNATRGGTGSARAVKLISGDAASSVSLSLIPSGNPTLSFYGSTTSTARTVAFSNYSVAGLTASSGGQEFFTIIPYITQTGTASYTAFRVNPTENSVGSGSSYIADFQVGGVSKMAITNAGNVGIGTSTPAAKLDVNGGIKVGNNAGGCSGTNNGELRYVSGASPPYSYCNGSAWVPFESGWVVPYTKFTAAKVMSALYHTCALKSTGALSCWGHNSYGQVSDGTTTTRLMPVAAGASFAGPWSSTSVGTYNTCGIKSSGSSGWCWGYNVNGQIGDGTTTTRNSPTQISGTWIQLDTGGMTASTAAADNGWYTCGVKNDNTGWCWGGNGSGALGDGTTTQRTSPVQVTGNWLGIWPARYGSHTCGIKTDNTLWCWGYNNYGQLGVGNTTDASTPQQVSGSWSSVVTGGAHTCGIKTDNTLWCWGYNGWGALGDGTLTQRTSPVQVSGGGSWSDVAVYSAGTSSPGITYGIKTDGTALSWGYNQYADTKTGSTATYLAVPTALATSAVTSGSQWTDFEGGYYVMCGVRDDSTAYCWGAFNYYNRFGDPNVTTYFNPVGG